MPLACLALRINEPFSRSNKHTHNLDQAGSRSLVFDLSIAHDRFGSSSHVQQNGCLSHPQDLDAPLQKPFKKCTDMGGLQIG